MADLKIVVGASLDQAQARKDLTAQLKKITNLKVKVRIESDGNVILRQAKSVNKQVENAYRASETAQTKIAQAAAKRRMEIRKQEAAQAKAINAAMNQKYSMAISTMSTIDNNRNILSGLINDERLSGHTDSFQSEISAVNNLIQKYNELYFVLNNPNTDYATIEATAREVRDLQRTFTETASKMRSASKYLTNDDEWRKLQDNIEKATAKLKAYKEQNSAFTKDTKLKNIYDDLEKQLGSIADPQSLRVWESEFQSFNSKVQSAGKATQKFSEQLKDNIGKFSEWFAIGGIVSSAFGAVEDVVSQVKMLDDSLTELRKVSDLTGSSLDSFVDRAFSLGSQIGRTGQEVIDATTTFKRAGYTLEESLGLAESALVMTNVGDNIQDTAEAASYLISVLKGFNMSDTDADKIVDMINETSNNAAIDFDNIAEGLRRVSSTMSQTGTSLSETIGLLTGGFGQLRDIEMVSSGKQQAPYVQKCA